MARPRRIGRDQKSVYVDKPRVLEKLLSGCDFYVIDSSLGMELDSELLREAWHEHREQVVNWHLCGFAEGEGPMLGNGHKGEPGSRPWGWWEYEAPEPRREVRENPGPVMADQYGGRYGDPVEGSPLWFGKPSQYRGMPALDVYESETDYLDRLGLLTKEERRILGR